MRRAGVIMDGHRYQVQPHVTCPNHARAISAQDCECNPGYSPVAGAGPLRCAPTDMVMLRNAASAPSGGDVLSAAWTVTQLAVFAAAGAALGAVVASQQKSEPYGRNAAIGAVALPLLAVL